MNQDDIFGEKATHDADWDGDVVFGEEAPPANMEFQEIPATGAGASAPTSASAASVAAPPPADFDAPIQPEEAPDVVPPERGKHWYQVSHWAYLFDVNTYDVLKRMLKTFVPIGPTFWDQIGDNPDFYGPFWITSTLIFFTAASGNLGAYLAAALADEQSSGSDDFHYRFEVVGVGAGVLYAWTFGIPFIFWGLFKWWKVGTHLKHLICLFGYSLTPYLPISFLCLIPSDLGRWIAVGLGCLISTWFVVSGIFLQLKTDHMVKALPVCLGVIAIGLALALGLKLYFWDYTSSAWETGALA